MAGSVNKVFIIGNLGKDPEIRSAQDGREIANLTVATSESWKDKNSGEKREKTEWHRVSIFSQGLVTLCKNYLKKGTKVYIEGALQTRKWTDKDGAERYTTEIVLQNYGGTLVMLGGKSDNGDYGAGNAAQSKPSDAQVADDFDDDIPFQAMLSFIKSFFEPSAPVPPCVCERFSVTAQGPREYSSERRSIYFTCIECGRTYTLECGSLHHFNETFRFIMDNISEPLDTGIQALSGMGVVTSRVEDTVQKERRIESEYEQSIKDRLAN